MIFFHWKAPLRSEFCNQIISSNEWMWSNTVDFFEATEDQLKRLRFILSGSANVDHFSTSLKLLYAGPSCL